MSKQFNTLKDLAAWVKGNGFDIVKDEHEVAVALTAAGYNMKDLTADGHGYCIDGSVNDDIFLFDDELFFSYPSDSAAFGLEA